MKSFAAMVFGQGRVIGPLVLFLIFGGISKPTYADVTLYYSGPPFSIAECQAEFMGFSPPPRRLSSSVHRWFYHGVCHHSRRAGRRRGVDSGDCRHIPVHIMEFYKPRRNREQQQHRLFDRSN